MKKRITYLVSLFFIIGLFSCSSDDNDLIGKWEVVTMEVKNCDDPEDELSFDLTEDRCFIENGVEFCVTITYEFKSSGSLEFNSVIEALGINDINIDSFTYSIEGNTISACDGSGCDSINFSINGDILEMTWNDSEDGCDYDISARRI